VTTPGDRPRLHGYDVSEDLMAHYGFGEVLLLALRGCPPTVTEGRACELALIRWVPAPVSQAPTHAAVLARLAGAPEAGVLAVGLMGLIEQARHLVEQQLPVLERFNDCGEALDARQIELPATARARTKAATSAVAGLAHALPAGFEVPLLARGPSLELAILAVLHRCKLTQSWQLQTALVCARAPALAAEAQSHQPGQLAQYAMNQPPFVEGDPVDE